MKDLRDPTTMGKSLLMYLQHARAKRAGRLAGAAAFDGRGRPMPPASVIADRYDFRAIPDYRDETTIEKYGDPRLLPSTMP